MEAEIHIDHYDGGFGGKARHEVGAEVKDEEGWEAEASKTQVRFTGGRNLGRRIFGANGALTNGTRKIHKSH